MKKKTVSGMLLAPLLISMLFSSFGVSGASANPMVNTSSETVIKVRGTFVPWADPGMSVVVNIDVEFPLEWDNTPQGIVGWSFDVKVNPYVLEPRSAHGADFGNYLFDFCDYYGYTEHYPSLLVGEINKTTGDMIDVAEFIMNYATLGVGAGGNSGSGRYGDPYGLARIRFTSLSNVDETWIDIRDAEYCTAEGVWHPFDRVEDGWYGYPWGEPVPCIWAPDEAYVNEAVTFSGAGSYDLDGYIVSYSWDFGDGDVVSTTNPTIVHTYTSIGTYVVRLVVTDDDGLISLPTRHTIRIKDPVEAVDIDPETLNLKSKGQWITAYIQLLEEYNPENIDPTTILLNETIQPVLDPKYDLVTDPSEYLVDHNEDGILERMVKFNRTEVASWIYNDLGIQYGNVTLTVAGELYDGTQFEGRDTIRVLFPGDVDDDGDVDSEDFSIFAGSYGMNIENPSYNPLADFNEDGYINPEDFSILSANYGKTAA